MFFACDKKDAAAIDFDDQFIYDELDKDMKDRDIKFVQVMQKEGLTAFQAWEAKMDKTEY